MQIEFKVYGWKQISACIEVKKAHKNSRILWMRKLLLWRLRTCRRFHGSVEVMPARHAQRRNDISSGGTTSNLNQFSPLTSIKTQRLEVRSELVSGEPKAANSLTANQASQSTSPPLHVGDRKRSNLLITTLCQRKHGCC